MNATGVGTPGRTANAVLPARSPRLCGLFVRYIRRYVARHVHAVRLSRGGYRPGEALSGPLLVVLNHPSWWDPLVSLLLAEVWTGRVPFAPIDAHALAKYPFMERLGFFGVEPGTFRGALAFLRQGGAVLRSPGGMLWVTAQGRFADPRERPVRLQAGVGHLVRRHDAGHVVPLALEYPFWEERTPEALARFGRPIALGRRLSPGAWTALIEDALQATQDGLAADALGRDPARFETLLAGGAGVGGVYDAWRRLRAALRGETFSAEHGTRPKSSPAGDTERRGPATPEG